MGFGRISVPRPRHRIVCFRLGFSLDVQTVSQPETCTQNMSEEGQLELLVLFIIENLCSRRMGDVLKEVCGDPC